MSSLKRRQIVVKNSGIHGWGVFAAEDISPGSLIEQCYYLRVEKDNPDLEDYFFYSQSFKSADKFALALGYGSIYNHSDTPNATHEADDENSIINFYASQLIKSGDEIFISYGKDWFEPREIQLAKPSRLNRMMKMLRHTKRIWRMFLVSSIIMLLIMLLRYLMAGFVISD